MTADAIEQQNAWLEVGASDKAASVAMLTATLQPSTILEVGCGTGAVLAELIKLRVGHTFAACEPSPELCEFARGRAYESEVDVKCGTFTSSGFDRARWDLIVLSHVLEHTYDPAGLLASLIKSAEAVVLEVPLEGTISGRMRGALRSVITGRNRTDNEAGHLQFFSSADIDRLVRWCGGETVRKRVYWPKSSYHQMAQQSRGPRRYYYQMCMLLSELIGATWMARVYYGHLTVLARSAGSGRGRPHPLYWTPTPEGIEHRQGPGAAFRGPSNRTMRLLV